MLKNKWYLICPSDELTNKILKKKILGEDIILFRKQDGDIAALEDRCCHRNVNLSLGYLNNNSIVCGYHGWEYNETGNCVRIPSQLEGDKIPPTAKIKGYLAKDFNKWVWVFLGDEEKSLQISIGAKARVRFTPLCSLAPNAPTLNKGEVKTQGRFMQ